MQHDALAVIAIHDLNIAMQYTDQLVLINQGMFVMQGAPEAVLSVQNIKACYGLDVDIVARSSGRPVIAPVTEM